MRHRVGRSFLKLIKMWLPASVGSDLGSHAFSENKLWSSSLVSVVFFLDGNRSFVARRELSRDGLICVYNSSGKIPILLWFELDCSLFWFDLGNSGWGEDHRKQNCKVPSLGDEQSNFCTAREQGNLNPVALIENLSGESEKSKSQLKCSWSLTFPSVKQLYNMVL